MLLPASRRRPIEIGKETRRLFDDTRGESSDLSHARSSRAVLVWNRRAFVWTAWIFLSLLLVAVGTSIWAYHSPQSAPELHAKVSPFMEMLEEMALKVADVKWRAMAKIARESPRFDCSVISGVPALGALHPQIVGLKRLPSRSVRLRESLAREGIAYEAFDGVDGLDDIDPVLIQQFAGPHTLELLGAEANDAVFWAMLAEKRSNGTISDKDGNRLERRFAFAAKLSFLTLLHKMAGARWPLMLIFEDDAQLVPFFSDGLQKAMCGLPRDWDILYLNSCHKRMGEFVGNGVRMFKSGACNLGFVTTLRFALETLHKKATSPRRLPWRIGKEARRYNDMPFDLLIMTQAGGYRSFIADPPLVTFPGRSAALRSVISGRG